VNQNVPTFADPGDYDKVEKYKIVPERILAVGLIEQQKEE
jgi:hypothetical protein